MLSEPRPVTLLSATENEKLLQAALAATGVVAWQLDLETGEMLCSENARVLFGVIPKSADAFVEQIVHPDDRAAMRQVIASLAAGEKELKIEYRVARQDRSERWFETSGRWLPGVGSFRKFAGVTQDITDRKRIELELDEARQRLAAKVEGMRRVHQIGTHLMRQDQLETLLQEVLEGAMDVTNADMASIQLFDGRDGTTRIVAEKGFGPTFFEVAPKAGWTDLICRSERFVLEDLASSTRIKAKKVKQLLLGFGARAIHSAPLFDRQGKILGTLATYHRIPHRPPARELLLLDLLSIQVSELIQRITEQRAAEGVLREREIQLRLITDNAPALISYIDSEYRYQLANAGYQRWFGWDPSEVRGKHVSEVLGEDAWKAVRPYMERALAGEQVGWEEQLPYRGIGPRWVRVTYTPDRDDAGRVRGFVVLVSDIEEAKRTEQALRDSEGRERARADELRAIMDASPVGICVARDPDCANVIGNLVASQVLGVAPGDNFSATAGQGEAPGFRTLQDGRDLTPSELPLHRAARGEIVRDHESQVISGDSREYTLLSNAAPLQQPDGTVRGGVVCFIDISERKRIENELRLLNLDLERRVAERTAEAVERTAQLQALAFELTSAEERERRRLAQVLHDHLQQLLVGAKIRTSVIGRKISDPAVSKEVGLLSELLHQAIQESRSLTAQLSPPILYDAGLGPALQWLARWMEEHHELSVDLSLDQTAEPRQSEIRTFLFQAARELLLNVVKYAGVQTATVGLRMAAEDGAIELEVSDTGRGFALDNLNARPQAGGFGLFSIRQRLEYMGGSLLLESEPGKGTRIILRIMSESKAQQAHPTTHTAAVSEARVTPRDASSQKIRLLLADDQQIMREGLAALLREHPDIQIIGEASDGQKALELARELRPDVVIMDAFMPNLNGVEATRILRVELPSIRVIGLSMYSHEDMAEAMMQAGATAYLTKDGPVESLAAEIRQAVGSHKKQVRQ